MNCQDVKINLYDYLANGLGEGERSSIKEHLEQCKACRVEAEEFEKTLALIDEFQPPDPSEGFETRVLEKLRSLPIPRKPLWQRVKDWLGVSDLTLLWQTMKAWLPAPAIKWQSALAVAVMVLVVTPIAINYITENSAPSIPTTSPPIPLPSAIEKTEIITIHAVRTPIIIELKDIKEGYDKFKSLAESHGGQMLQVLPTDSYIRITLRIESKKEPTFFTDLSIIGKVQQETNGFRDEAGNIVIVLKKEGIPTPSTK